jgi:DNA-binding NarL/FixJ family response regulator
MADNTAFLVSTNPILRQGLKSLLAEAGLAVIAEAESLEALPKELAGGASETAADLILVEVPHNPDSCAERVAAARAQLPGARVVALSGNRDASRAAAVNGASADAYASMDLSDDEFCATLKRARLGEAETAQSAATFSLLENELPPEDLARRLCMEHGFWGARRLCKIYGWSQVLHAIAQNREDALRLPDFGSSCTKLDLTPAAPKPASKAGSDSAWAA